MKKYSYKFSSLQPILAILEDEVLLGPTEIAYKIGKSKVLVHKYLKELLKRKLIQKVGKGPQTKYALVETVPSKESFKKEIPLEVGCNYADRKFLDEYFYKFSPIGEVYEGFHGLQEWSRQRGLGIEKTTQKFLKTAKNIHHNYDECGMLHATNTFRKYHTTFVFSNVYYADQYSYQEFGRGRLAEMSFYAKTTQNKKLIQETFSLFLPKLECLIARESFDAIAIVPWSIQRKNQILDMLKKELQVFGLPFINIIKYYKNGIAISQKSLKTRAQRLQNAKNTIFLDDENAGNYKKVLLIDDFVGSGATLYETALKLKAVGVKEIVGFAFVGNIDLDYEVISEM